MFAFLQSFVSGRHKELWSLIDKILYRLPFLEKLLQSIMLEQMLLPNYITSAIFSNLVT